MRLGAHVVLFSNLTSLETVLSDDSVPKRLLVDVFRAVAAPGLRRRFECLCIVVMCLGAVPAAQAQAGGQEQEADPRSQASMEALVAGLLAMREQNLELAETLFEKALATEPGGGEVHDTAREGLTYHLPLRRLERYVATKQWRQAERLLRDLRERHRDDEAKSGHLQYLLVKLRERTLTPEDTKPRAFDGRKVVHEIEKTLDRFLAENGRYPGGYEELNEILPADQYPLIQYDIVHYVGRGRAYDLRIRSKTNPGRLLTVQRTGLVQ